MAEISAGRTKRVSVDLKKVLSGLIHAGCGMGKKALMACGEFLRHAVRLTRRFWGIREIRRANCGAANYDLSAAMAKPANPEYDGFLEFWMDGLRCRVELFDGYTSFGRPGGTWRGDSLPDETKRLREGGNYAFFKRKGDSYKVFGAGDKAKIFVRGEPLKYPKREKIHPGDKILVGNCELVFFRRSCPTVTEGGGEA